MEGRAVWRGRGVEGARCGGARGVEGRAVWRGRGVPHGGSAHKLVRLVPSRARLLARPVRMSQMVETLNLILLTSSEAWELRHRLKQPTPEDDGARTFFVTIYPAWAHNPVALLSVCLLAQAYEHAAELVLQFGALEMSLPFLVQIDRLVQVRSHAHARARRTPAPCRLRPRRAAAAKGVRGGGERGSGPWLRGRGLARAALVDGSGLHAASVHRRSAAV